MIRQFKHLESTANCDIEWKDLCTNNSSIYLEKYNSCQLTI